MLDSMKIVAAKPENLAEIMEMMNYARFIMHETGNSTQWSAAYPSELVIMEDIQKNQAYLCVENGLNVGYFCFFIDDEPNYQYIENGKWENDMPYGVIHRLASSGKVKGIAKACFDWAFFQIGNIRVDTHKNNKPMHQFLKNYGFSYCGQIHVRDGSPRDAFQLQKG